MLVGLICATNLSLPIVQVDNYIRDYIGSRGRLLFHEGKEMATGRHISLPKPFASGDVNEWCQRFEICSKANEWNDGTMALKLPTLLEGEALAVWIELTEDQQKSYATAKKEMVAKMAPVGFVSLEDFHRRKLQPGEAVSVFVHDLN